MNVIKSNKVKLKTKRTFIKQGTCSRTFFYILNRKFGHPKPPEEQAADPLAGGIVQQGYQCGMLWGAALAIGAESFRRHKDSGKAIGVAIKATRHMMGSFVAKAKSTECEEITKTNFTDKWGIAKYMLRGKFITCFRLAGKWAPDAIESANEGLAFDQTDLPEKPISCASEVIKKMGGTDEEAVMVAGFAGGLGLSGSGCGALSAAIWKTMLELSKTGDRKVTFPDPEAEKIIQKFNKVTDYEMECHKICGKRFKTVAEHTDFIQNGGCSKLIEALGKGKN